MKKSIDSRNSSETSSYLGIDFGQVKIGIAVADQETRMAFVLGIFKNDKNFWDKMKEICDQKNVEKIIIGISNSKMKSSNTQEQKKFGEETEKKIGVSVEFQEEMFTTKIAHMNLLEKGEKNISKIDDGEAARIILQSWLDK
ncbi:MAG: hypothetical protein ACD_11C00029G0008 [uncultured bacterium]|nr:MAG: hypothetical protein ACD_11C00029G0008 [uncultured bacterium]HBR71836.1 Holliday junction resolvase RuvX [Candidatus Moranbacteria bacterium]